ncbi:hypothetical protein ACFOSD_13105 [Salinispirillum marinum]|uniref:MotA/TolQ/ExbB proton channel domain-containing protein n=3 Tax=Saccharospirillaceae TaxID=255527 RepID=A0ABV8BIF8_9GAMM
MLMPWMTTGLIGVIALLTIVVHFIPRSPQVASQAPSILTTLGIFGTFIGVALGLYQFDVNAVEDSVPSLLEGLKTAFWSSIAGLLGALSIKIRYAMVDMLKPKQASTDQPVSALIAAVELQAASSEQHLTALVEETRKNSAQLAEHQANMVEANTRALSAAIKDIISDFNARIEVQYGDNFKNLNESVGRMLAWQTANHETTKAIVAELERATVQMTHATTSYERLMQQTQSFSHVAEGMDALLTGLNQQSEQLAQYLSSMSGMVQEAQKGLPDLEQRIGVLTTGLAEALKQQNTDMQRVIEQTGKQWLDTSKQLAEELASGVTSVQQKLVDQAGRALAQSETQLNQLDEHLEQQLTQSLQSFGYQLTALSEKFVNDYTPLTERLRALLMAVEQGTAGTKR